LKQAILGSVGKDRAWLPLPHAHALEIAARVERRRPFPALSAEG